MRRTLGTAVFSGMIGVTLFGLFLTPFFYYVIMGLAGKRRPEPAACAPSSGGDGRPVPEPAAPGQGSRSRQVKEAATVP